MVAVGNSFSKMRVLMQPHTGCRFNMNIRPTTYVLARTILMGKDCAKMYYDIIEKNTNLVLWPYYKTFITFIIESHVCKNIFLAISDTVVCVIISAPL